MVGGGGREHALAWRLSSEGEVHVAPGNPGTADCATLWPIRVDDHDGLIELCGTLAPDFIVIGPEGPLIDGLGDALRAAGQFVVGPNRDGSRLEGSKAFSKDAMERAGVPTAAYRSFTKAVEAHAYVRDREAAGRRVVVKASGVALGKGAVVCDSRTEATDAIERMLVHGEMGDAGRLVVVEDRLEGPEYSLLTLCTDAGFRSLPVAQDYKRAGDGDTGPNTGGMGTHSPVPWVDDALVERTEQLVVGPILRHLASRGVAYRGVLFSGLMLVEGHPYCLEYNVRFGDPETQTVMMRLGTGLAEALRCVSRGDLVPPVEVLPGAAATVVVASEGYPGAIAKGRPIRLPEVPAGSHLFHAGTAMVGDTLVTAGGRVLGASAYGPTPEAARIAAYRLAEGVRFEGAWFRRDIGL